MHAHRLVRARKLTHPLLGLVREGFVAAMAGGPALVCLAPDLVLKIVGAVTVSGVLLRSWLRSWIEFGTLEALLFILLRLLIDV